MNRMTSPIDEIDHVSSVGGSIDAAAVSIKRVFLDELSAKERRAKNFKIKKLAQQGSGSQSSQKRTVNRIF